MEANNGIHNAISEFRYTHHIIISLFAACFYRRNCYLSEPAPRASPHDDKRDGARLFRLCPFFDEFDYIFDVELPDHEGDICCQVCKTIMRPNNVGFALSFYGIQC